ncbi:short chain dehydrogenase [Roseibium sediminicola]|uniref:Short chain dehydrogenase n=1 Tax=Roseibium sediminicola TaxID=2933272 RepID=A0ABT0H250_9HYPH|nr:short chain dehydrogenase [Roseibium sp. CAU 1639]MCK7615751.1 short chain dehydrogenase [Roseibium sp. CAU 1639]
MKIIVVGAAGDVGQAACKELGDRHEIITVGRSSGDHRVDMADIHAVKALFDEIGDFDAVISCAGDATFAPLSELNQETFMVGLRHKVMGQVNLVLAGLEAIADGGSFTLTSGVLDRDPIRMGTSAATANGALAGFVKSAAIEMPRGLRINVVSPGMLDVSASRYGKWFHGHKPVLSQDVGLTYAKCVEGALTGQVVIVE